MRQNSIDGQGETNAVSLDELHVNPVAKDNIVPQDLKRFFCFISSRNWLTYKTLVTSFTEIG